MAGANPEELSNNILFCTITEVWLEVDKAKITGLDWFRLRRRRTVYWIVVNKRKVRRNYSWWIIFGKGPNRLLKNIETFVELNVTSQLSSTKPLWIVKNTRENIYCLLSKDTYPGTYFKMRIHTLLILFENILI